ncbi:tyrosine-protein phosphatase [Miniimonas sp. S16]|uniref:tyrosine-protein phosphatase n=1 Tax=Miniimonas sp. S16 TaxID=2171623 RepID=UPI000D527632|nr:tyrosine-protein phosphatase [Miniimonas sp. S16]
MTSPTSPTTRPEPDPATVDLTIEGTWNARDAASLTGVAPRVLLRTAALQGLTDAGRSTLLELGVTDVVDLRSDPEVANQGGDAVPDGVAVHRLAISPGAALAGQIGGAGPDPAVMAQFLELLRQPGWAQEFMVGIYREIVADAASAAQLGAGLRVIARAEGATVVHCSAGKDRTGVLVALACTVADVPAERIEQDFLWSNRASAAQAAVIPELPGLDPALLEPFLGVSIDGLRAAEQAVTDTYGGMDPFLAAVGVGGNDVERLRGRLLG